MDAGRWSDPAAGKARTMVERTQAEEERLIADPGHLRAGLRALS
jgi:hypothetical protein